MLVSTLLFRRWKTNGQKHDAEIAACLYRSRLLCFKGRWCQGSDICDNISPFTAEWMEICRYVQTVKLTFNPEDLLGVFCLVFFADPLTFNYIVVIHDFMAH